MSPKGPYYNTYCYHLQLREDTIETIQLSGILFSETDRTTLLFAIFSSEPWAICFPNLMSLPQKNAY